MQNVIFLQKDECLLECLGLFSDFPTLHRPTFFFFLNNKKYKNKRDVDSFLTVFIVVMTKRSQNQN